MKNKTNEKEYISENIRNIFEQWNNLRKHGGSDPFWEDGFNMNNVRGHIIGFKKQCEQCLLPEDYPEEYFWELPPEVDNRYMARSDEIRKHARDSLAIYEADENYIYLKKNMDMLTDNQKNKISIVNVINYTVGLRMFIERDMLVEMRRHEHPELYLDSFRECRKRTEEILADEPEEKPLPIGQLSLFDLFGLTM